MDAGASLRFLENSSLGGSGSASGWLRGVRSSESSLMLCGLLTTGLSVFVYEYTTEPEALGLGLDRGLGPSELLLMIPDHPPLDPNTS